MTRRLGGCRDLNQYALTRTYASYKRAGRISEEPHKSGIYESNILPRGKSLLAMRAALSGGGPDGEAKKS